MTNIIRFASLCVLLISIIAPSAKSDSNESHRLSEVSVSAAPIESPILSAPISATIIKSEDITERSQDNLQQIIDYVPNLNFAGGTSRSRFFQIRGVGELEQYTGAPNPSVGYILDDLDLSGLGAGGTLFDINQIEVLRGPQSLKFGSSALAGVINQVSTEPTKDYQGKLQISGGMDDLRSGGAAIGGPIEGTDGRVFFRLSAFKLREDGFRKNLFLNRSDTNRRDEFTTRGKLKITPNEWLEINAMATWIDLNNGYDAFAINNSLTTQSDRPGQDKQKLFGSVLKSESRLPEQNKLITVTTLSNSNNVYGYDGDWGNPAFWEPNNPYDYYSDTVRRRITASQEIRLSSDDENYIHGESSRYSIAAFAQRLVENATINQLAEEITYDYLSSRYRGRTVALFFQAEYPLFKGASLSGGLRGEQRDMTYRDSTDTYFNPTNRMNGGNLTLGVELGESSYGYLQVAKGFKGGGFNPGLNIPEEYLQFGQEALWNLETGVKVELIDNSLRLSTSIFTMFRRNQQVKFGFQQDPNDPLTFTYITDNAAKSSNTGIETELTFIANSVVDLFLSASYLHSEFDSYTGLGRDLSGREQSHAPPLQFAVGSRLKLSDFFARADLIGRSSYYFDDVNDQRSRAYQLLNLTIGYARPDWDLQLWARNLLDKRYAIRGFYFGNEPPNFPEKLYIQRGDPLHVGITFNYHFSLS